MFINHEYIYKILEETKNPSNEQIKEVLNRAKNREGQESAAIFRLQYCRYRKLPVLLFPKPLYSGVPEIYRINPAQIPYQTFPHQLGSGADG